MPTLAFTLDYARQAHEGQIDGGGEPHFEHVERVVENTRRLLAAIPAHRLSEAERDAILQVAALHDTTEDTAITEHDLIVDGFEDPVVLRVRRLDGRPAGVSYHDNIVAMAAEGDIGVILVKLGDNLDNGHPARIAQLPPERRSIARRYAKARVVLEAAYMAYLEQD